MCKINLFFLLSLFFVQCDSKLAVDIEQELSFVLGEILPELHDQYVVDVESCTLLFDSTILQSNDADFLSRSVDVPFKIIISNFSSYTMSKSFTIDVDTTKISILPESSKLKEEPNKSCVIGFSALLINEEKNQLFIKTRFLCGQECGGEDYWFFHKDGDKRLNLIKQLNAGYY